MGRLPSIFKNRDLLLQWRRRRPSCVQATKTLSFRAAEGVVLFGASSRESTEEEGGFLGDDQSSSEEEETIIREVMRSSERLFFEEPGECATSSLIAQSCVEEAKEKMISEGEKEEEESSPFKESVIVAMETKDPYRDFKRSMQEMVECYVIDDEEEEGMKLKNWEWLQELLGWYLKMNVDGNHGFILGAFVDLLVELYAKNFSSCDDNSLLLSASSYSSALSSPLSSSLGGHMEIEEEQG